MNKYKNIKITIDNIEFDSKKEASYYSELKLLKRANVIKDFELQPKFELIPAYTKHGKKVRAITYIADFKVTHTDDSIEVIDVKGIETEVFKIKKKLFEFKYPYKLTIV